jgi:hypothetical protein
MLRETFRVLNRILSAVDLHLERGSGLDFESRLSGAAVDEMVRRLAAEYDEWTTRQDVFDNLTYFDTADSIEDFYEAYLASPFRSKFGGSRFNNQMFLHLIAKGLQPALIIDSGTYQGASAWALSTGAPGARVISFDIDLSRLLLRLPNVEYVENDWTTYELPTLPAGRSLCYFDDHLDQVRRLLEASERGIRFAIFDDDFPLTSFALMAHGGGALPKIEFALDPYFSTIQSVEWLEGGTKRSWTVDQQYLARARGAISKTDRLPNISLTTGIHQTPYRVVSVRQ